MTLHSDVARPPARAEPPRAGGSRVGGTPAGDPGADAPQGKNDMGGPPPCVGVPRVGAPRVGAPLAREYDDAFAATPAYRATLPDLQNGPPSLIRGARRTIQHVGIHGFRLPLRWGLRAGERTLDTSVTGTVSLGPEAKGINMSRIMRAFYAHAAHLMDWDVIGAVLDDYGRDVGGADARLALSAAIPLEVRALRSGLVGWQHYDACAEMRRADGVRILYLDYVYASTCPCSLELAEHARAARGRLATPHAQRSVARLSLALDPAAPATLEDVVETCRRQIPTETQAMVLREDEQAFAELSAAHPVFVEDAARLLAEGLTALPGVGDYRVACSHQESLHSHDAVSVIVEGDAFPAHPEPHLFASLVHRR